MTDYFSKAPHLHDCKIGPHHDDCTCGLAEARAELAAERELADRLAASVKWFLSESETNRGDEPMADHNGLSWNQINEYWIHHENIAADILAAYTARRNK